MEVTSSASRVSSPPAPRPPERDRAQEYRVEQERLQQRAQRQEEGRKQEPVLNTQGQTTGRIVNAKA